jgi:bifunctional DNase/RNase
MKRPTDMLDMTVAQLTVDPFTNMPLLILRDPRGGEALPIWIGLIEASAIATELEKIALDRPMTHDLMKTIIGHSGMRVDRVEVRDVVDNTFYATIHLKGRGKALALDSRPSDAIALALRTGARICVARKVLEQTRFIDLEKRSAGRKRVKKNGKAKASSDSERLRELLESLSDEEFGKWKM